MGSRWIAEFDIIFYGISKKIYLLEYLTDIGEQTVQCVISNIYTADCNFPSSTSQNRAIRLQSVLFPAPDGPTIAVTVFRE